MRSRLLCETISTSDIPDISERNRTLLNDVLDPPRVDVVGGCNEYRAPVKTAAFGGSSGFIHPSLRELLSDTAEEVAM